MSFITADLGSDQSNFVQSVDNSRVYMGNLDSPK